MEKVETQHLMKNLQGRSIILDIYATDYEGKRYDVEIQRADRGAGAKRARYHSSLIDANVTDSGDKLENLAETYVSFITERDVIGKGLPIYHVIRYETLTKCVSYFMEDEKGVAAMSKAMAGRKGV